MPLFACVVFLPLFVICPVVATPPELVLLSLLLVCFGFVLSYLWICCCDAVSFSCVFYVICWVVVVVMVFRCGVVGFTNNKTKPTNNNKQKDKTQTNVLYFCACYVCFCMADHVCLFSVFRFDLYV